MDTTLTTLLADIRRQGSIPNTEATGSQSSDLIAYINEHLIAVASEVIKCREGFYRWYKDHTLSTTQPRYRIPSRAIGNRLAAVLLLDSAGDVVGKLNEITYSNSVGTGSVADTAGYFVEGGDIVLTPAVSSGITTLRMVYYVRPNQVTSSLDAASGSCFTVTSVSGNVLTLMASHGILTTTKIDIIKAGPPHEYLTVDEFPSAVASSTVTVADGSRVEAGDFVVLADKSPVAQLPDAFRPPLALLAAQSYWMALNESEMVEKLDTAIYGDDRRPGAMKNAVALIAPRVEEGARKIMSPYGVLGR